MSRVATNITAVEEMVNTLPINTTITEITPDAPATTGTNIFSKSFAWVKENPVKASLIGVVIVGGAVVAFSKPVQRFLGLRKKTTGKKTKSLSGTKKRKTAKKKSLAGPKYHVAH